MIAPGETLGSFRIVRELGEGGMGVVYLAEDTRLGRLVALKLIAPILASDSLFRERFESEARSAAAIEHPNVVTVYSAGEVDDHLYIAMHYVDGSDLRHELADRGSLGAVEAVGIAEQVAQALDAAHARGLVHRDVKPANILLSAEGGSAFLSDFGLTKGMEESRPALTGTGNWVGTLNYVAPEQLSGGPVGARTDIYALGCVLFEMLAGRIPFSGTDVQKMWGHVHEPIPPLVEVNGSLAPFDSVIARATAKEPDDRYPSAGDLGRAAAAAAAGAQVTVPERSVATGQAASGIASVSQPPMPRFAADQEGLTRQMPRTAEQPRGQRAAKRTHRDDHGTRGVAIVAAAFVLAAGLVAGGIIISGGGNDDASTVAEAGDTTSSESDAQDVSGEGSSGANEPTSPQSAEVQTSLLPYSDAACACSTVIPSGDDWSAPIHSEPTPGELFRTTVDGPEGMQLIIDYTPFEEPTFTGDFEQVQEVEHPVYGSMTEYILSESDLLACSTSTCVDYLIDDGRGGGWGVLVGGGNDPALAQQLARRIATELTYYDI